MTGKQVRLFLVDGTPGGLMTAEIMNWTGHVLKGKREKLAEIRDRDESRRTGVYVLLGESEDGGALAYVGQSDDVGNRLTQHDARKDWWTDVVIVTSKDTNLTSAHVRYLESRLIRLAKSLKRIPLENGNEPSGGAPLPEADASDMDYFIDQLRILLPVLGVDLIRGRDLAVRPAAGGAALTGPEESPEFRLLNKRLPEVDARARQVDGEFTVLAGSRVRAAMRGPAGRYSDSTRKQYMARQTLHTKLVADGAIEVRDGVGVVTRDIVFSSPSAAGAVVQGIAACNGRTAWISDDGTTFGQWQDSGVE